MAGDAMTWTWLECLTARGWCLVPALSTYFKATLHIAKTAFQNEKVLEKRTLQLVGHSMQWLAMFKVRPTTATSSEWDNFSSRV
eukprot:1148793-Pelagomonas_calceolata.AAC.2